jgi:hypothetical protein
MDVVFEFGGSIVIKPLVDLLPYGFSNLKS